MEFTHVPHQHHAEARKVMKAAAGQGEATFDLPRYADTQFPKRIEIAAILAADTLKGLGQWDREADHLNVESEGGKRMERALGRLIHDFNREQVPEGQDVKWLARRMITDVENQSFANHVVNATRLIDDHEYANHLSESNHPVYMIASRLDRHPDELRTMEMQAMGWYESMPESDQRDMQAEFKHLNLTPNQESYLEVMAEPYAHAHGMPQMDRGEMAKCIRFPDHVNIEHAAGMIDYHMGRDREPEAKQYFADDPYLAITSAVLNTIPSNDFGYALSGPTTNSRETIALARVMATMEVAHKHGIEMTNHDIGAMMLADIKMMANQDRSNMDRARERGTAEMDNDCIAVATGRYTDANLPRMFFPGALTDKSVHISSNEQKLLVTELIDVGLKPNGRFQFERANDPEQRDSRMALLHSIAGGMQR